MTFGYEFLQLVMFLWYLAKMVVIVVLLLNDLISTNHLKG